MEKGSFGALRLNPCEDDSTKWYADIWFQGDWDDISIHLLLNGALTKVTKLPVTAEQYKELSEHGIPKGPSR